MRRGGAPEATRSSRRPLPRRVGAGIALGCLAAALSASRCGPARDSDPPWPADTSGMDVEVVQHLEEARRGVQSAPRSAESWGRLGQTYQAHELFAAAASCYERARSMAPREFRWAYFLAIAREKAGAGPTESAALLREAAALRPDYAPLHLRLGALGLERGSLAEAREAFSRAAQLAPQSAMAWRGLGQCWLELGDAGRAIEALKRSTALDAQDAAAWSSLARALSRAEQQGPSRAAAATASRLHPRTGFEDPELSTYIEPLGVGTRNRFARAQARLARGEYAPALAELAQVERRLPAHPDVLRLKAKAQAALGQADQAGQLLERALELAPDYVLVHIDLARLEEQRGQPEDALARLRRAREIDPHNTSVLGELIRLHAARGDLAALIETYGELAALLPADPRIPLKLGTAWLQQGRPDRAATAFRQALALEPDSAEARQLLQKALAQSGSR